MSRLRARAVAILAGSLWCSFAGAREPTGVEQYALELLNRARQDPNAEVVRLSRETWGDAGSPALPDLNEGLDPGTLSGAPRPPLAFDPDLVAAASSYAGLLLASETFGHAEDGTPVSRMAAAGYPFDPPWGSGENLAITSTPDPRPIDRELAEQHHRNLFVDGGVSGRGHRVNLLDANFREIGIAFRADSDTQSAFGPPPGHDVVSARDFAFSSDRIFVTGVIYHDDNGNAFYDPGESAGNLAIEVRDWSNAVVASGRSFSSGGYSVNLGNLTGGSYTLAVIAADGTEAARGFFWDGATNVKVDLVDPPFTTPPVFDHLHRPDGRIGPNRWTSTGDDHYSATGAGQTVSRVAHTADWLEWHSAFENDGATADEIVVEASGGNSWFDVIHLERRGPGWENVTAELIRGIAVPLAPGEAVEYVTRVRPTREAIGKPRDFLFRLTGRSGANPTRSDRVRGFLENRTR